MYYVYIREERAFDISDWRLVSKLNTLAAAQEYAEEWKQTDEVIAVRVDKTVEIWSYGE